jgi:hypothetical protein
MNSCAFQKIRRISRILVLFKKSGGFEKYWLYKKAGQFPEYLRFSKNQADLRNLRA